MSLNTPIAFLIFNRPDVTHRVFERIASARPKTLLVVADGPRTAAEAEKCRQTRAVLEKIDWDCTVFTNFSDTNLGCKLRVSSGLDWVFSQVEEAIVLEDDCIPSISFFQYCETMLDYYRHDERVMVITGSNLQDGVSRTPYSYYFSKLNLVWGWASWRRAWKHYDVTMASWPEFKDTGLLRTYCDGPDEEPHWTRIFDTAYNGQIDTWDFQWLYACWAHSGLTVTPDKNLISNVGFGPDATHTTWSDSPLSERRTEELSEIIHPPLMTRNCDADLYAVRKYFMPPLIEADKAQQETETSSFESPQSTIRKSPRQFLKTLFHAAFSGSSHR